MALRAEELKSDLTEQVVHQIRERVARDKIEAAERFVRQFYANVSPDDILRASPEQLYGAALAIWQFAAQRRPGAARVRVYNPQVDEQGWQSGHTVVEMVNDDMPFLVDSVTAELNRVGLTVHLIIHPVVRVRRDADGRLTELLEPGNGATNGADDPAALRESFMHIQVDCLTGTGRLDDVRAGIERVLADVRAAVQDWRAMRERVRAVTAELDARPAPVPAEEADEAKDFLRWADEDHFTFLGHREYRFAGAEGEPGADQLSVVPDSGLGILRDDAVLVFDGLRNFATLPPDARHFLRQPRLLMVTKTNRRATIHRRVPMDCLFVKAYDDQGRVIGERVFVGLFTSSAYSRSVREVPFLRRKVARTLARSGFDPHGHDGKALLHILEGFPRDELFQIGDDELLDLALGVLHLQERQRLALFVRRDPFERFASCMVYVPRDRYDTDLRKRIQAILERSFNGSCATFYTQLNESVLARVHFLVQTEPGKIPDYDVPTIEARLIEATRAWTDRLQTALIEAHGEESGLRLFRRHGNAFPTSYRERFSAEAAVFDIDRIEEVMAGRGLGINLYRPLEAAEHELRFKIYHEGRPVPLSDVLPMLEHMDTTVITEVPFEARPSDHARSIWIHDFEMLVPGAVGSDFATVKEAFHDAFLRVWNGESEDDGFNRLVLRAGLTWREIRVLRAYAKYLRQVRFAFSQEYMENTLAAHAPITRLIMRLFLARLDPARPRAATGNPPEAVEAAENTILGLLEELDHALDAVISLEEDRILRRFVNLVRSTLRTNHFQKAPDGGPKPYLSFKLDSRRIEDLPLPRPLVEVFVFSPRVEAIHLRGGKVARGGIRWSDRREDFRTEILGLMKAQMVKNAVIVPVGSKGGFVVKRPPPPAAGREAFLAEGIECYKTLMRGLLDLTDNFGVDGTVIPQPDVLRLDGDDPYLVVAADKGTATFSDIANSVSLEYGFWLGDAFASGGSAGYDHKKMGITARGAWESVKRHFREIGTDIQTQDFTAVGVGDMAGDVFGNALLLSRHTRLVGAFNHVHIFCDPDPDPEAGFEERRRLFTLPRSAWSDYDPALISRGGGVFERSAKSLTLSPEIKARFGFNRDRVTPAELIQAMLLAPVDLLFFGGIGTFVKSSEESHADVGDKANDALRVDANAIRAPVIGEGANLAMTQRARIEYARRGGRLNTDAIDNSAGVDTSDHEVNIKVLLGAVIGRGDMTLKQRNELLVAMTDEVGRLVLYDNYLQTQALTVAQAGGPDLLEAQARFMRALEKAGRLNRTVEMLPDEEELNFRLANRQGLTRPELAILLAYAKITLYDDLLASNLPDDPRMVEELVRYFPHLLREDFRAAIEIHRLRREIIATVVTNSIINRVGPTFVREMIEKTGMGPDGVARAYTITRAAFDLRRLWSDIQNLDTKVPAGVQTAMLLETGRLLERVVDWFLAHGSHPLDITAEIAAYRPGVEALADCLRSILGADEIRHRDEQAAALTAQGVPGDLAQRIATLPVLASAVDVTRIARLSRRPVPAVAAVYFALGHRFGIEWLRHQAERAKAENHWQKQALAAIVDDLFAHQSQLTVRALDAAAATGAEGEAAIEAWIAGRRAAIERVELLLAELRTVPLVDLAMLAIANRQLRGLIAG